MSFHLYQVREIFSSADGSRQFIELVVASDNEHLWAGHTLEVRGATTHSFLFEDDLPGSQTSGRHVLLATQAFQDDQGIAADFTIPEGFLFTTGGSIEIEFVGANQGEIAYSTSSLPTDGVHSLTGTGGDLTEVAVAVAQNFAGQSVELTPAVNPILGTPEDDDLTGTPGVDAINALAGNDTMAGAGGNDTLSGGSGRDTVLIEGSISGVTEYSLVGIQLMVNTAMGRVIMNDVERVHFDDLVVAFDTHEDEPVWQAQALLWAAFGAAPGTAMLSEWTAEADALHGNMVLLADHLVDRYAPGVGSELLVAHLFGTLLGIVPTAEQVEQVAGWIGEGQVFPDNAAFLAFVAEQEFNTGRMAGFEGSIQFLDPAFF